LSTHAADLQTDLSQSVIDRVLYGDGAAAAVVSPHPLVGPCLRVESSLDHSLPDSLDWAVETADAAVLFDSIPAASRAVTACMPGCHPSGMNDDQIDGTSVLLVNDCREYLLHL
jgi:hypothetical protein